MNEWSIAIIGGCIGGMIMLFTPQRSLILKQILIIGVVGYITTALLLLHYQSFLVLPFTAMAGIIGKKLLYSGIRIDTTMKGGEEHE